METNFDSLVGAVQALWVWQHANTGSFQSQLITLYRKADAGNRAKLNQVYPFLGPALTAWESAGNDGDDLFRAHGLMGEAIPFGESR